MAAFLLGWGGLSVQCQTMSVLRDTGLSIKPCLVGKLLHGLISAALAVPALRLLPGAAEAGLVCGRPVQNQVWPEFGTVLLLSAAGAAAAAGTAPPAERGGAGKKGWKFNAQEVIIGENVGHFPRSASKKTERSPKPQKKRGRNMLFRTTIDPRCAYCRRGGSLENGEVICPKKGIVSEGVPLPPLCL